MVQLFDLQTLLGVDGVGVYVADMVAVGVGVNVMVGVVEIEGVGITDVSGVGATEIDGVTDPEAIFGKSAPGEIFSVPSGVVNDQKAPPLS